MAGVSSIDLNLLIALAVLLEERNLTRAGEKVNMSQPAMSGALARLRRHFDDELLVRDGHRYQLTPLAERLLPDVRDALRQVERTLDARQEFDPPTSTRTFSVAISDYAVSVLVDPLLRLAREVAPGVGLTLNPIPPDMEESERGLLQHDLVIGPVGYMFPGESQELFRDRFVCIVDPANPRLASGALTLGDLSELPYAVATFGEPAHSSPADKALDKLGVRRHIQVFTEGWLPLPFVVAGTGLVAIVPERLARRVAATAEIAVCEPPFGTVELIENAWWHPSRSGDPALRWLRSIAVKAAAKLLPRCSCLALQIEISQVRGPLLRFPAIGGKSAEVGMAYTPGSHAGPFAVGMFADDKAGEGEREFAGLVVGGRVREVAPDTSSLLRDWDFALDHLGVLAAAAGRTAAWRPLEGLRVLPPVRPGQVLQSGANYRQHVIDLHVAEGGDRAEAEAIMDARAAVGEPYIFTGLPSAICGPADDVILPIEGKKHDWELEIAVVIGRPARRVSREDAMDYVAGYTICNDITTRDLVYRPDLERIGTDWLRAKNRPTFLPTGPYLVPASFVGDPGELLITLRHNGVVRQQERAKDMIFDIPRLVSYASALVPLSPGDLLLTGSPAGNGAHWGVFLGSGDVMEGEVTGLGRQRNTCVSERLTTDG